MSSLKWVGKREEEQRKKEEREENLVKREKEVAVEDVVNLNKYFKAI